MSEVNFCARITKARGLTIKAWLARKDKTKGELMNHVIDNINHLRPALDSICHNGKRRK